MNRFAIAVLCIGLAAAGGAQAQSNVGYATSNANLRAGPDTGYPRVSTVPAGAALDIYGCVDDWSWCDVQWRGERGWMSAGLIEYERNGSRYYVDDRGAWLGLPILTFALDIYWADHYLRRPWYHEHDHWSHYRPPPRPPHPPHPSRPPPPSHGGGQRPPQVSHPGGHTRPPSSGGGQHGGGQHRPTGPQPGGQQHAPRPASRPAVQPSHPGGSHSGKPPPRRPAGGQQGKPHGDHHP